MNNILPCIDHKYDLSFSSICQDQDSSLREELSSNIEPIELEHEVDCNQSFMALPQINDTKCETDSNEKSKRRQVMEMILVEAAD